ncbi:MAG: hypothetical protein ACXAC2_11950 [Candidatus Kariarchaeaceae archaeon]
MTYDFATILVEYYISIEVHKFLIQAKCTHPRMTENNSKLIKYNIIYSLSFDVEAENEDEARNKVAIQIRELMKDQENLKKNLKIETVTHSDTYPESYIDDWDFDEVW